MKHLNIHFIALPHFLSSTPDNQTVSLPLAFCLLPLARQ